MEGVQASSRQKIELFLITVACSNSHRLFASTTRASHVEACFVQNGEAHVGTRAVIPTQVYGSMLPHVREFLSTCHGWALYIIICNRCARGSLKKLIEGLALTQHQKQHDSERVAHCQPETQEALSGAKSSCAVALQLAA